MGPIRSKTLEREQYLFTESGAAKELIKKYMKGNNSTLWFVDEYCELDLSEKVSGKTLYDAYKKICSGTKISPVSQREFYAQIEE